MPVYPMSSSPSPTVARANGLRPSTSTSTSPRSSPPRAPSWIIPTEQVTADPDAPLGKRNGSVFKGSWNDRLVAVKKLSKETSPEALLERVELWEGLNHPHVLRVFGASPPDADPSFLITQCHLNGNVNSFLAKNPGANRPKILLEVAVGMQHLHGLGLVHGSLKPTNILITDDAEACVADCGMIEINPSEGTFAHRYFSPEAWKGTLSRPSDVFAFGMTAFEIFTSTPPWGVLSDNHIYQLVVREDSRPDRPEQDLEERVGLTDQIWAIMTQAWHKTCRQRPSFDKIVEMWENAVEGEYARITPYPLQEASADAGRDSPGNGVPMEMANVHAWRTGRNPHLSISSGPPAYDAGPRCSSKNGTLATPLSRVASAAPQLTHTSSRKTHHRGNADTFTRSFTLPMKPVSSYSDLRRPHTASSTTARSSNRYRHDSSRPLSPAPSLATTYGNEVTSYTVSPAYGTRSAPLAPMSVNAWPNQGQASTPSSFQSSFDWEPGSSQVSPRSAQFSTITSIDENRVYPYGYYEHARSLSSTLVGIDSSGRDSGLTFEPDEHPLELQANALAYDNQSVLGGSQRGTPNPRGGPNAVLLAGALHAEVMEGRKIDIIDKHLATVIQMASASNKEAEKLVTAGTVPTLIRLLKARAVDAVGLEVVLMALGVLAYDSISANTIYRTNTATTLIEIFSLSPSPDIAALSVWCINRICRSAEVAAGLIKQNFANLLMKRGLTGVNSASRLSAWCLGSLACTDALAETLASQGLIEACGDHLRICSDSPSALPGDICAAVYVVARLARSIKISKALASAGCVKLLAEHLNKSTDSQVLLWSARAVGCLMRPNSSDMSKALLDAGTAKGLARLPHVLPTEEIEPLEPFAFAIQRFSCAEWGGGTRKALVDAGVVDSLLAALRTAADVPYPRVHTELALAVSFLGDVGGSAIRKEIINAGGIDILKRVAAAGKPEVAKACNMAVTSITGNLWSRNAASAKTALAHNWSGGCPDYQPECPLTLADEEQVVEIQYPRNGEDSYFAD